jgi:Ser-tRNA(Ala) deacylase AlaX
MVKKDIDPRMHSAEHILNQTMVAMFGIERCFSAHIEKKKSKCDYHIDRALTSEEVGHVEQRVNEIIAADLPVTEHFTTRSESQARFDLDRLPQDTDDAVRIVEIGDYDACPCIGPHVSSTKEIGLFRIISTSFEKGALRIRYKLAAPPQ